VKSVKAATKVTQPSTQKKLGLCLTTKDVDVPVSHGSMFSQLALIDLRL